MPLRISSISARLSGLGAIPHGGVSPTELVALGLDPVKVVDLSVTSNPYPPPASVKSILAAIALDRHPDPTAGPLREAIADHLGVSSDRVVAGNGSADLIHRVAQTCLAPGGLALVLGPTFGEYGRAARLAGAEVVECRARAENGFELDFDEALTLIARHRPCLVFCCNPNNPTGRLLLRANLEALTDAAAAAGSLVLLDETHLTLADQGVVTWCSLDLLRSGAVVLLRSLSQDFGLSGLQLGYAVTPLALGRALNRVGVPWALSGLAQAVGRSLFEDSTYLDECRARLARDKAYLLEMLTPFKTRLVASVTNYVLIDVADGARKARDCRRALLGEGVAVRDCASFGLPDHIRVRVHERPAIARLVPGLERWTATG